MTLLETMAALTVNDGLKINVRQADNTKLITFDADGYRQIDPVLAAKEVTAVKIVDLNIVTLVMAEEP